MATVSKAWNARWSSGMAGATKKRDARKSLRQPGWITLVDDPNVLPGRLRLAFARDARTGRNCAVVWRRGKSLGVKFVR
jgi:hypothetical protein